LAGQVSVKCYPNPFNEQITIEIQFAESQKLDVKIYDVTGKLVRNLYKGESEERKVLVWDGKNEQGTKVVPGSYLLKANEVIEKIVLKN
jgi:flagellar hook assembly protein FlgD